MTEQKAISRSKRKKESQVKSVLRHLAKNKLAMAGGIIMIIMILAAIFAPFLTPYTYEQMDTAHILEGPSAAHLCGTDIFGRDMFTRLLYGARYSLALGFVSVFVSQFCGIIIGSVVGFYGGRLENVTMRVLDVIQSIPGTLLTITIATVFGSGFMNTVLALAISHIPGSSRTTRALVLSVRKNEYLEAAEACNCSDARKIFRHILPNILGQQVVNISSAIPAAIFLEAYLSFIGLGIKSPMTSWGQLCQVGSEFYRLYPYQLFIPGVFISVTILAFYLFGNCLRDALDPHLRD